MMGDNEIISNANYTGDYQSYLDSGLINLNGNFKYKDKNLENDIYIYNNSICIKADDVYDEYVSIDANNINFLNNIENIKNIISILNSEVIKNLEQKNYKFEEIEYEGKKVNKIMINFKDNYPKIKNKIINQLINNNLFVESVANYKSYSKEETINYIKKFDFKNYKFILYISDNNEFIGFDAHLNEHDFKIKLKDQKYIFNYYLRDGLIYKGDLKIQKGKLIELNIKDIIYQIKYNFKIKDLSIKYNEKNIKEKNIEEEKSINYKNLNDKTKNIMKENFIIKDIYNNYLNRYNLNVDEYNEQEIEADSPDRIKE